MRDHLFALLRREVVERAADLLRNQRAGVLAVGVERRQHDDLAALVRDADDFSILVLQREVRLAHARRPQRPLERGLATLECSLDVDGSAAGVVTAGARGNDRTHEPAKRQHGDDHQHQRSPRVHGPKTASLPTTDYRLPTTDYRLPTTDYRLPTTDYRLRLDQARAN